MKSDLLKTAHDALDKRRAETDAERRVADQLLVEWAAWARDGVPSVDIAPNVLARYMPRRGAGIPLQGDEVYLAVDRAVARLPFRLARVAEVEYRTGPAGVRTKAIRAGLPRQQYTAALEAVQYSVWCQLVALGVLDNLAGKS